MKKLFALATLGLSISATSLAAGNSHKATQALAGRSITAAIRSQIHAPDYLKDSEGEHDATIIFKVNSCGILAVQDVQTEEEDLRQEILSQVAGCHVNGVYVDSRDTYSVVLRFRTL